jgi:hypothetical protein
MREKQNNNKNKTLRQVVTQVPSLLWDEAKDYAKAGGMTMRGFVAQSLARNIEAIRSLNGGDRDTA